MKDRNSLEDIAELGSTVWRDDHSAYAYHRRCSANDFCTDHKPRLWIKKVAQGFVCYCHHCNDKYFINDDSVEIPKPIANIQSNTEVELPSDCTKHLPGDALLYLFRYGLMPDDLKDHNIWWSEKLQRIIFPIYKNGKLMYWQGRYMERGQTDYPTIVKWYGPRGKKQCYKLFQDPRPVLVLVEDIISAIRIGYKYNVYALLGTYLNEDTKREIIDIDEFKHVIIWFDNDANDKALKLYKELSLYMKCDIIYTRQDPKCYNMKEIEEKIEKLITC